MTDLREQRFEVSQASDRLRRTSIQPRILFAAGTPEQCFLHQFKRYPMFLHGLGRLFVSHTKLAPGAAGGEEPVANCGDLCVFFPALRFVGNRRPIIWPVIIKDLENVSGILVSSGT